MNTNMSSSRYVIQSICHPVDMSSSRYVIQSICHPVNMSSSRYVIQSICHPVNMSSSRYVIQSICHPVDMSSSRYVIQSICHPVNMSSSQYVIQSICQYVITHFSYFIKLFFFSAYSVQFIWKFFKDTEYNPLYSIIPSPGVTISLVISWCITYVSDRSYCCAHGFFPMTIHIAVGAVCLLLVLLITYFTEHELSAFVTEILMKRREEWTRKKTE